MTWIRSMSAWMASAVVYALVISCRSVVPSGRLMVAVPWPMATLAMGLTPINDRELLWS